MEIIKSVLFIDKSKSFSAFAEEAIKRNEIDHQIHFCPEPEAAIRFLSDIKQDSSDELPCIIIINFVGLDDDLLRQWLAFWDDTGLFVRIPKIGIISDEIGMEIEASSSLSINCFIEHPSDYNKFMFVYRSIELFWLNIVQLPPKEYV